MSRVGRPMVRLRGAGLGVVELTHGDLIGRLPSAALFLDDPRVSEAHALVSLRAGRLWLLALRRLLGLAGRPVAEVALAEGVEVELAEGLALTVDAVAVPDRVLAVQARGHGPRVVGQVLSIVTEPAPAVVGSFVPGAAALLWSVGDRTHLRVGAGPDRVVTDGDRFVVASQAWTVCAVPVATTEQPPTQGEGEPLRIVAHYDSVVLQRPRQPAVVIGGTGARILSELISRPGPVPWETLARELWTDEVTTLELRHRWDVMLGRLRGRLRRAGVARELVRSDRAGAVQLVLAPGDVAIDQA